MKLTIKKAELLKALAKAQGAAGKPTSMPILASILMVASETGLEVTATDLQVGIRGRYEADVETAGGVCCLAKKFYDIVRELPEEDIKISVSENNWVSIVSGKSKFRLAGIAKDEFPEFPQVSAESTLSVPAKTLCDMIRKTAFCAGDNDTRYVLNGILCHFIPASGGNTTFRMVATDGHRLAMVDRAIPVARQEQKFVVPKRSMLELKKLVENLAEAAEVEIAFSKTHFIYKQNGTTMVSKLIDGSYPNYMQVIPRNNDGGMTAQKDQLIQVIKRVAIMLKENKLPVKFELQNSSLHLSAVTTDVGEATESLAVNYAGKDVAIGFNAGYVQEALAAVDCTVVKICFDSPQSPGLVTSEEDKGFLCVCMPMRI